MWLLPDWLRSLRWWMCARPLQRSCVANPRSYARQSPSLRNTSIANSSVIGTFFGSLDIEFIPPLYVAWLGIAHRRLYTLVMQQIYKDTMQPTVCQFCRLEFDNNQDKLVHASTAHGHSATPIRFRACCSPHRVFFGRPCPTCWKVAQ